MKGWIYGFFKGIRRVHLRIYLILLGFSGVFYLLIKGASGHKFRFTKEEQFYALLYGIVFLLAYGFSLKNKLPVLLRNTILSLFLFSATCTLILVLKLIHFAIYFNYDPSHIIAILITMYALPILFLLCNLFLIERLIKELIQKQS